MKYNINNDYSYLARMQTAREREIEDYLKLKRESESAILLSIVASIDILIAVFAMLVLYT